MRARLALLASGQKCEIREVKLSAKPDELVAVSPKATVPVLVLPDGRVIEESLEIMRWALDQSDSDNWLAGEDIALIDNNDGPFKHHLDRYKYPERHGSNPAEHRAAGLMILQALEERLAGSTNLCGNAMGLSDAAIMPFIRQFSATDRTWFDAQKLPHLQAWLAAHLTSDLFERAMIRLTPWQAGDAVITFPEG